MGVIGSLLGLVLLLFLIVLVVRAVLDWTTVLSSGQGAARAREISHRLTEPVIGPVRRVLPPVRVGEVQLDLAFTVVFFATVVLRALVT